MPGRPVLERKHTLDGRVQTFETTAVLFSSTRAVVRFDHTRERHAAGLMVAAGSYTLGFFWPRRHYICYRIAGPDGVLLLYRFDVAERVQIRAGAVSFHDLVLDLWVTPTGTVTIEDDDEVVAALASGLLSARQHTIIERTRTLLLKQHRRVMAECEAVAAAIDPTAGAPPTDA